MLDFDQHSGWASIYPSAAHYLVAALASLRDANMNIKIEGFYDRVIKPTDADRQMMAKIDPEIEKRRGLVGFDKLVRDPKPEQVIELVLISIFSGGTRSNTKLISAWLKSPSPAIASGPNVSTSSITAVSRSQSSSTASARPPRT